jgi:hypothetical protein
MTQEIIQMARDSGMELYGLGKNRARFVHHLEAFAKLVAEKEREACVKECKKLFKVFLSSKYSTGQPLSSFKERHAVAACIESIEARGQA